MAGSGYQKPTSWQEQMAQKIVDLESAVRDLSRPRPLIVPVLATDPPVSDPTNVWLLPDGRLRIRHLDTAGTAFVTREFMNTKDAIQAHNNALHASAAAPGPGSGTSGTAPGTAPPAPRTYTKTYTATWSAAYRQDGTKDTTFPGRLYYGKGTSVSAGIYHSLIGFNAATMVSDLANSTVKAVKLKLHNVQTWYDDGATISFGMHTTTSEPSTWPGLYESKATSAKFPPTQVKTISLPLRFGTRIRAGIVKGIALEAASASVENYGFAGGVGSPYVVPQLIITYAK